VARDCRISMQGRHFVICPPSARQCRRSSR
jgi:hypothetical protein